MTRTRRSRRAGFLHWSYEPRNAACSGRSHAAHRRVGRVLELLQHVGVGQRRNESLCLFHCALHALDGIGQDQLGAEAAAAGRNVTCERLSSLAFVSPEQYPPLQGHGRGHGENQLIPLGGRDECEANASVAAGWLDESGLEKRMETLSKRQKTAVQPLNQGCHRGWVAQRTTPGLILPAFSASSIMAYPILHYACLAPHTIRAASIARLSLTLQHGSMISSLADTLATA